LLSSAAIMGERQTFAVQTTRIRFMAACVRSACGRASCEAAA
jgi:hypothetical protein